MKLDTKALAIASAATGMLIYAIGAMIDRLSAWGGAAILSLIFRVDVVQLSRPLTLASFVVGVVTFGLVFGIIAGAVGWGYNLISGHSSVGATSGAAAGLTRRTP